MQQQQGTSSPRLATIKPHNSSPSSSPIPSRNRTKSSKPLLPNMGTSRGPGVQRLEGRRRGKNDQVDEQGTSVIQVVGPTSTPGLLSLNLGKPITVDSPSPAQPSQRRPNRTAQRRNRKQPEVIVGTSGEEGLDEVEEGEEEEEDENDEEDEEEILFFTLATSTEVVSGLIPETSSVQPERPQHKRTMSEPLSVSGGMDGEDRKIEMKSERKSRRKKKEGGREKGGLERKMEDLMLGDGKEKEQTQTQTQTKRKRGKGRGKLQINDDEKTTTTTTDQIRLDQTSSGDDRPILPTQAIPIISHHRSSTPAIVVDTFSRSMPSDFVGGNESDVGGGGGPGGKLRRTGGKGKQDGEEREEDVWVMPDVGERKGDGALTWQQMDQITSSPLHSRRNRTSQPPPSSKATRLTKQNTVPIQRTRRDLMAAGLAYSTSEKEDGPVRKSRPRGGGSGDDRTPYDTDVFSTIERFPATPLKKGFNPIIDGSKGTVTPRQDRPIPPHTVSAPMGPTPTPVRGAEVIYAGPRFHNSPSAEMLPAPRLLRGN